MGGRIASVLSLAIVGVIIAGALRQPQGIRAFAQGSATASKPWISGLLGVAPR